MDQTHKELKMAQKLLADFEKSNYERSANLEEGLSLLVDIISEEANKYDRLRASNVIRSHMMKMLDEGKSCLLSYNTPPDMYRFRAKALLVFMDSVDPIKDDLLWLKEMEEELKEIKNQLVVKWLDNSGRTIENMKIALKLMTNLPLHKIESIFNG